MLEKHTSVESNIVKTTTDKSVKCYDCNETFKWVREMMLHRKNNHPNKVKLCRDKENCQQKPCGFMHSQENITNKEANQPEEDNPTKQGFQKDPVILKPPLNPGNKAQTQNWKEIYLQALGKIKEEKGTVPKVFWKH